MFPLAAWIAIEDLKKPPEPRRIEAIRVHPRYHAGLLQHDLALLTLEPEKETKGPAISLATDTQTNGQASLRIYGFGNTERIGHAYPQKIRTAALAEIPNYRCQTLNGPYNLILEEQVCAGDWEKGRRDACDGDSGGPLVLEGETDKLYGLVSWGVGCGQARSPGVYTRITSYADWIDRERKALGSLPIEELAQAVFYFPLFETPSTQLQESQRRFTAGHHIWKRTESPSRGESRGLWRRLLGDEELTLELFRGDGDQYELRLNYQGKVYETQATYQDLRKVK